MKSAVLSLLAALVLAPLPAPAPGIAQAAIVSPLEETIDIVAAMAAVTTRFFGQVVAAELVEGRAEEGVAWVYQFRLLTPGGDILRVRVDGTTGAIIDVEGRGLVDARRPLP